MRSQKFMPKLPVWILTLFAMLAGVRPAQAVDQVSVDNLQAAMRTLSFLESLPKGGPIVVGVLYAADTPDAQSAAEATAQFIGTLHGPNSRPLQPLLLASNALAHVQGHRA